MIKQYCSGSGWDCDDRSTRHDGSIIILFDNLTQVLYEEHNRITLLKGNQKGKVTCYARERVNKNELFWMVITFLKSVVY